MLGLGAMGWHTLLQSKMIPFDSFEAMMLNSRIFSFINQETKKASRDMATILGEPEWCKGFGIRNTHTTAIAPNVSNSIIGGSVSSSIEPITSNAYALKSAKGVFIRKNIALEQLLSTKGKNTVEVWNDIIKSQGSVQHLKFLSSEEKEVYKTAREINQYAIVNQAAQRQKFIDQSQSLNLFFTAGTSAKYINDVHLHAWKSGVKSLYYLRSESVLKGTAIEYTKDQCAACDG
jgi:ribonucleoside-diphosphate reductase alpha chain